MAKPGELEQGGWSALYTLNHLTFIHAANVKGQVDTEYCPGYEISSFKMKNIKANIHV